ncbi:MAG TPA: hypothetical protein VK474_10200 [Chthoniobacterales bacterium]|nr:hypothetical protein [Chthoniobacterales bacterium]
MRPCARLCSRLLLLFFIAAAPLEEKRIIDLYARGLAGDKEAVLDCIAALETVCQKEPGNHFARVYLGSAYTLRSRDLGFGPNKLKTLQRGVALMDEAVTAAPNEPKVRLTRALTTAALPAILGYRAASRRDFQTLAEQADRQSAAFEEGDLQIIYYNAGLAAKAGGDQTKATALWQKARAHPAESSLTRKIETALQNR